MNRYGIFNKANNRAIAAIAGCLLVGVFAIYVKYFQMQLYSGYLIISRYLGKADVTDMSFIERLSFFREDILLHFVLIPISLLLILKLAGMRAIRTFSASASVLLAVLLFVGFYSLSNTGQFLNYHLLAEAALWGMDNPDSISDYISWSGFAKLLIIVLLSVSVIRISGRSEKVSGLIAAAALVFAGAAVVLSATGYLSGIRDFSQHQSVLRGMMKALAVDESYALELTSTSDSELADRYRSLANIEGETASGGPYFGSERDADVLFFVLETAAAASLDYSSDLSALAAANQLSEKAFVMPQHYSTYPYTSDALFSVFSSLYPIGRREFVRSEGKLAPFGMLAILAEQGYVTSVYSPVSDTFSNDTSMFSLLGATRRYVAQTTPFAEADTRQRVDRFVAELPHSANSAAAGARSEVVSRMHNDLMALAKLKSDITRFKSDGKRFAAVFIPQIGHAPWLNLYDRSRVTDRGRDIIRIQDQWLAEIVSLLERNDWLKETVIVVTADHGIRTRTEDPSLEPGKISSYTYRVPLLLYAPNTPIPRVPPNAVTSHIDIMPTLLQLLGLPDAEYPLHGIPIWDARLGDRTVYFLGRNYLGVDGFHKSQHYYMFDPLSGTAYQSSSMDFGVEDMLGRDRASESEQHIAELYALGSRWIGLMKRNGNSP